MALLVPSLLVALVLVLVPGSVTGAGAVAPGAGALALRAPAPALRVPEAPDCPSNAALLDDLRAGRAATVLPRAARGQRGTHTTVSAIDFSAEAASGPRVGVRGAVAVALGPFDPARRGGTTAGDIPRPPPRY